ncbi:MAG TPA: ABC-F family ATP-binding cassette domain-containing protein [Bryobacteraceae bacterium]|jgi:ATP-binding cassette subfamily F protein 3|nr:ABC-F family ATP-binding cassette domain-containing protein [Bryobacteraceae bacterium]
MMQLNGAGKRYGPKILFEDVDWLITPNERTGLVGANGTGKSSLLKVLAGIEGLDSGSVTMQKGVTLGYLPQDGLSLSGRTVFAECMTVFSDLRDLEIEQEQLTHRMAELDPAGSEYAQVADRFQQCQAEFLARDGYTVEAQVGTVLSGLGFPRRDWKRRTEEFSGGWQMRIALAKLLLEKPNLLLLDEPTNHLDLEARNWLEDYLHDYPNAVVLVSHDRYFLDVTVRKIAELWNKGIHFYTGGFTRYEEQKTDRRAQLQSAYQNQRDRIEQLEAFINRFRYQATKAKQVQSRIKELEKIERIEVPQEEKAIHFRFPQPRPSGRIAAEFKGVAKAYGDHTVFSGVDFYIERGDRVALVGVNGAGKSTMIKILAGAEPVSAGEYTLGHNAQPDYFAQDQYKELDQEARMIDDLATVAPRASNTELRSILGSFLFSEDDVFKPIGVLSGGERNRYALARMLMQPSNFLLLDEPTNHLDMRAKDVLLTALQEFQGTLVFVSHDRYFIDKLAGRIFEVEEGRVHIYPGNYEDYLWRKGGGPETLTASLPTHQPAHTNGTPAAAEPKTPEKRVNPIKLRQMEDRRVALEAEVSKTEVEITGLEASLANFVSVEETVRLNDILTGRRAALDKLVKEWEEVVESIEANA